jgi:uncharacterized membrane protein YraQ (UPF0718 family)/copper chaperone CopZ
MIITFLIRYFNELFDLLNEMAPYLLLGFLFAGLLHIYFPKEKVSRFLGKNNFRSVLNAALIGIPLPLCSCGVIPTGISFFKSGASRGSSVSFLISTPQTGIDSIMATYSLLGLPLAIIRPIIALVTGVAGGIATNLGFRNDHQPEQKYTMPGKTVHTPKRSFKEMIRYAFVEFLQDISKWLVIGLLIAALMAVLIPDDFFSAHIKNEYVSMLIMLIAAIPLYVCATGSVPIAAVLLMKGLSPGAIIVFLMAGPATNAATMTVIGNVLGRKTLYIYLLSIIVGAVFFGVIINEWMPRHWFTQFLSVGHDAQHLHLLPPWLKVASGILLVALIINGYVDKFISASKIRKANDGIINIPKMSEKTVKVNGMTCNHCKMNVEKNLGALEGIERIEVDLSSSKVRITGDHIDLDKIKSTVEGIGYDYIGEAH